MVTLSSLMATQVKLSCKSQLSLPRTQHLSTTAPPPNSTPHRRRNLSHLKSKPKSRREMKLEWSPETASKAFIDTVKTCENFNEFGVAELLSATAAGWNAKLIAEAWSPGGPIATSVGLSIAAKHTGGKHLCIVTDERSRMEYIKSMKASGAAPVPEVSISNLEEDASKLEGIDFLVVDCKRRDFARVLREVKAGNSGAVFVCKNASERNSSGFRWNGVLRRGTRIVRTEFLPVGKGLEIAHIGSSAGNSTSKKTARRWIKHVDQLSGEEHFFREPLTHPRSRV